MKKKLSALFAFVLVVSIFSFPSQEVDAQPILTLQCCDSNNVVRCRLDNWTPLGNPCFCYQQGWGHAC